MFSGKKQVLQKCSLEKFNCSYMFSGKKQKHCQAAEPAEGNTKKGNKHGFPGKWQNSFSLGQDFAECGGEYFEAS
jgi:hypothetical protein